MKFIAPIGITALVSLALISCGKGNNSGGNISQNSTSNSMHFTGQVSGFDSFFPGAQVTVTALNNANHFTVCASPISVQNDRKIDFELSDCNGTPWKQVSAVLLELDHSTSEEFRFALVDLSKALETGTAYANINSVTDAFALKMEYACSGIETQHFSDGFQYIYSLFPYSVHGKTYSFDQITLLNDADAQEALSSGLKDKLRLVCDSKI